MAICLWNVTKTLRIARTLATHASSSISPPAGKTTEHDGPLRPHLNIAVDPNHGLFGFFRVKTGENSHLKPKEGEVGYAALDVPPAVESGRSWNASELRRKSFKDLHTLWYILLRERNLLATQKAERIRLNAHPGFDDAFGLRARKCQKSMARIKAVLTERRNAYIRAARLRGELRRQGASLDVAGEGVLESEVETKVASTLRV